MEFVGLQDVAVLRAFATEKTSRVRIICELVLLVDLRLHLEQSADGADETRCRFSLGAQQAGGIPELIDAAKAANMSAPSRCTARNGLSPALRVATEIS